MPVRLLIASSLLLLTSSTQAFAQYEAPATYYGAVTSQTGAALKTQLSTIMASGHVQSSYAEARDFMPFTDANPDNLTQMFEFYTRAIIQKPSASHVGFVGAFESREHVWPDSLQGPGDTSNSTRGSRGDIHMLKPLNQSTNSSRGNNPFGNATATGAARNMGGFWFPGMSDKGDAARIIFYGATRYQSTLSLVNGAPTSNTQMGDQQALLRFHYQDVPDLFERRRNDTIYRGDDLRTTGDDSSYAGTRNRNAYIDRPEYAWSVFADQQNDTRLSLGVADSNGASAVAVDLGRVLRNASLPAPRSLTLTKAGVDGTYYEVRSSGLATSSISGRLNAFAMDATGARTLSVGLATSTATAGLKSGVVTVDNLDVTTLGGPGRGANDADDVATINLSVLSPSNPSFAPTDANAITLDFDVYAVGTGTQTLPLEIFNLASPLGASLTAGLDLDGVIGSGATTALGLSAADFAALPAGASSLSFASLDTSTLGAFSATYRLIVSDEDLPGTQETAELTAMLTGRVAIGGDADLDADVDFADLVALAQNYQELSNVSWSEGDFNRDGGVTFADLVVLAQNYGVGSASGMDELPAAFVADFALARTLVPEPIHGLALGVIAYAVSRRSRVNRINRLMQSERELFLNRTSP